MATQILIKRSSTGGGVPTTSDITAGEFAVNLVDRKLYTNNGTAVIRLDSAYVDSTAPANGVEGDLWYDTANNLLKTHNGTGFVAAGYTTLTEFGVTATAAELNKLDGVTATTAELNKLDGVTATTAEINYIDGVTSNIQTQLNGKSATTHNHTLDSLSNTTITSNTSGEILKWNGTAWVNNTLAEAGIQAAGSYAAASHTHTVSDITDLTATATELNYTDGVTSNIQTQLNGKASTSHNHTLDGLSNTTITSNTSGEILKWNGTAWINNTLAEAGIQAAGSYAAASHTHTLANITDVTATAAEVNVLDGITATTTELNYTDGVTSNIQTQLNGKASTSHNHTLDSLSNVTISSNSSGEVLQWNGTAWINRTLAEAGIQPSGSYLTSESDTLATVTARGASTSNAITITNSTTSTSTSTGALKVTGGVGIGGALNVGGNTIITGNLTVNGTTTTVNSNTVNIGDNILVLNSDETGTPSQSGGIEIERGTSVNVSFLWDETNDYWTLGDKQLAGVTLDGGSY